MDYVVSKSQQIAVVADSPDDALLKAMKGEGNVISTNYSAQPRPQPPQFNPLITRPVVQPPAGGAV